MAIKLTKNEQKVQKDRLKQYQRYLPTLQLKKQQLQAVIPRQLQSAAHPQQHRCRQKHHTRQAVGGAQAPIHPIFHVFSFFQDECRSIRRCAGFCRQAEEIIPVPGLPLCAVRIII